MKKIGDASSAFERIAEVAISTIPQWQNKNIFYEQAAVAVVSPVHRAVESACFNLKIENNDIFLKVRHPDMNTFFDDEAVALNCDRVAITGVTPILRFSNPDSGILAFDRLDANWNWGKVDDFADPKKLENTIIAKKKIHDGLAFANTSCIFQVIDNYREMVDYHQVSVPSDVPGLLLKVQEIADAIEAAGYDNLPCHGDGVASNIMFDKDGNVKLVDFDRSANMDPYYDLGSFIVEAFQFAEDAHTILEIYDGVFIESHYNRCRLYGIADDIMWALWGFICFKLSSRKDVEFTKYAEWRLLRCRWNFDDPEFRRWMGHL
jgi:hypothetical protein